MKSKKIILLLITLTILASFVPTKVSAKSNANNKTIVVNSEKNNESGLSENLKKKVDPFILVENNRFVARIPDSIKAALYEIADLVNKGAFHASRLGVIVGGVTVGYFTSGLGAKIGTAVCTYIANQLLPGMPELDPYSSNTYRPMKIKTTWLLQVSHSYQ